MYEFVTTTTQPYPMLTIVLGASIFCALRRPEKSRRPLTVVAIAWGVMLLLSLPALSHVLLGTLQRQYPPPNSLPPDADVIVTLGGGIDPPGQFRSLPELDGASFNRCLHTAAIYDHLGGRSVIVCGGPSYRVPGGPSVAEVMQRTLVRFGLPEGLVLRETASRSTSENAVYAAELLRRHRFTRPILVTDGRHMPRAVLCFRKQGIDVIPAPCDSSPGCSSRPLYELVTPSVGAMRSSEKAVHEWLGIAWYWATGRL